MPIQTGSQFPYLKFRGRYQDVQASPVIWKWKALADDLATAEHTQYGTLTLSLPNGSHQPVPGTAMTFQVVRPGGRTTAHSHSWWHLYFVRSGKGSVVFDEPRETAELDVGDIMLIPAWSVHHFENHGAPEDMVLLSITNLSQQADLANLMSREFPGDAE